ncbi:hypothetical protein [Enterovirga rhinocerotis]|uniref:Uncharacterized protein n=1 Tax=Enterovirga rhinocerotis TaxID=1339210 RepID=A0A4R7C8D9_9HYPH|nr:hypothetical protein [Enterovirga rhinocerotis]TDR94894.1 hypothetical protein EV668_2185 [Enterovirga rhinocerotis]
MGGFDALVVVAMIAALAFVVWRARRRRKAAEFAYEGRMFRRSPGGGFETASGAPVAGAVLIGALAAAHAEHLGGVGPEASSDASAGDTGDGGGDGGGGGGDGD